MESFTAVQEKIPTEGDIVNLLEIAGADHKILKQELDSLGLVRLDVKVGNKEYVYVRNGDWDSGKLASREAGIDVVDEDGYAENFARYNPETCEWTKL